MTTPQEKLEEICEILQIEYEDSDDCFNKITNNIEELLTFKTDYLEEQDWKEKYENLREELQDIESDLYSAYNRINDIARIR